MPGKTKIGTEVAHITCDSEATFKVKGQGHQAALLTAALINASGSCSGDRGDVLAVGTCYVAVCRRGRLGGARRFGAHRGKRGAGAYCGGRPPTVCYIELKTMKI